MDDASGFNPDNLSSNRIVEVLYPAIVVSMNFTRFLS